MHLRTLIVVLALLVGGALVWAITAGSDESDQAERVTSLEEKRAVRIERQLADDPNNKALLVAATKQWLEAGNEVFEATPNLEKPIQLSDAIHEDYEAGLRIWNDYLEQSGGEASVDLAGMAASIYFQLVEIGSRKPQVAAANAAGAARAQQIVVQHEPSPYTLGDLANYQYFNGEYAAGDKTVRRGALLEEKSQRSTYIDSFSGYKERGEKFVARVKRGLEELEETGEEELEAPIKGYGDAAGINGYEPGTGPGEAVSES